MPIEMLEDPEGIRDMPGGDIVDRAARIEAERCAGLRADAILLEQGAEARAGLYTPTVIAGLSIGTVGFMLAKILNGEVDVRDAKQAIEVAKIALLISDKVADDENLSRGETGISSPASRADAIEKKDQLTAILRERAKQTVEKYGTDVAGGGFDASEWDLGDDENPAAPILRAVPSAS